MGMAMEEGGGVLRFDWIIGIALVLQVSLRTVSTTLMVALALCAKVGVISSKYYWKLDVIIRKGEGWEGRGEGGRV